MVLEAVDTIDYHGYTIAIHYDEDAGNPLKEFDSEPTLVLHRKAERHLGWTNDTDWAERLNDALDELNKRHPLSACLGIIARWMRVFHSVPVVLPIGAIDHSGVEVYLGDQHHWMDPGGWDSGWIGWMFATREQLAKWGTPPDRIKEAITGSFEQFAAWVAGDVYGYIITGPDGEQLDSCWGFYGSETFEEPDGDALAECKSIIDAHIDAHADDPADPPKYPSWHPCKWQTHAGVIAPMWDTDPTGPTGWDGWCGIPTDDATGLCTEHREQLAAAR